MKPNLIPILFFSLIVMIFLISCSKSQEGSISVEIKNAEYKEGSVLLTVQANQAAKNSRIDIVGSKGEILCSKYNDLAAGTNQLEVADCKVEKEVKVSVSPPGQPVIIEDFKLELPMPSAKIEDVRYELNNLVLTFDANLKIDNARVEVASAGNVLCTKYANLNQGKNELKFADCGNEASITVSLTPPGGALAAKDFKMDLPMVKVQNAVYDSSTLVLTLDANAETKNTRVDIIKDGNVLCTKYFDLIQGKNEKKIDDCGVEEKLTISIAPELGLLSTKEFALNPPLLKLQKGFRYDYAFVSSTGAVPKDVSIYVTEDSPEMWEGINGIKLSNSDADLIRFKINKNDLTLRVTSSLKEDEVFSQNLEFKDPLQASIRDNDGILIPFWFVLMKQQGLNLDELFIKKFTADISGSSDVGFKLKNTIVQDKFLVHEVTTTSGGEVKLYSSTAKPYLMTNIVAGNGGALIFKGLQKKDFSLSDYAGYNIGIGTATPLRQVPEIQVVQPVQEETPIQEQT